MYLLLQLLSLNVKIKVCINNYEYFKKHGGEIDIKRLKESLGCEVETINAKKCKLTKTFLNFSKVSSNFKINADQC